MMNRWLYWLDYGKSGGLGRKIARMRLDGSEVQMLVTSGLYHPRRLTLDLPHQALYWTERDTQKVLISCSLVLYLLCIYVYVTMPLSCFCVL